MSKTYSGTLSVEEMRRITRRHFDRVARAIRSGTRDEVITVLNNLFATVIPTLPKITSKAIRLSSTNITIRFGSHPAWLGRSNSISVTLSGTRKDMAAVLRTILKTTVESFLASS